MVWPVSEFTTEYDTVAAARAADVRQANYYRSELAHQRDLLGEQMAVYEAALARYQLRGDTNQMHRIKREMRCLHREQHTLEHLLAAIDYRFGCPGAAGDLHGGR